MTARLRHSEHTQSPLPTAFTREMTRILRDKQTHPLIAQMMKPAASSDPPPDAAAASGASSSGELRAASHEQFQ